VEANNPADAVATKAIKDPQARKRGRWMLWLVLLVCASPLIASYFTYYVIKPEKRSNYGTLVDQRAHPLPADLATATLDGTPQSLAQFKGKWVMLMTAPGACAQECQKQLYAMRQLRLMQGKEQDRIERVWLISDREPLETLVIREYDGTHMLRADAAAVKRWLPADGGTTPADHIYMIDPLGHLMMRFPQNAEPRKVHKDIYKLLKASSVG
jgi:peroxiredoxin